jgi:excisionase family DNA binding protein
MVRSDEKVERAMATAKNDDHRVTISVRQAGKRLGIGVNQAYEAAHRGEIPVIRIGSKRMLVPLPAFERMLSGVDKNAK